MHVGGDGKCQSQHSVAAVGAGEQGELLFVKDYLSGRWFLVGSGSQRSHLPPADFVIQRQWPTVEPSDIRSGEVMVERK